MILLLAALAGYIAYLAVQRVVPRYLLVPPHDWRTRIDKVLASDTPVYLPRTAKRSSWRRRLVAASGDPSFYTNFLNDRLKISPRDRADAAVFRAAMADRSPLSPLRRVIFGFFHPYANNGGGGERVLWQAVKATLDRSPRNVAVVYTTNADAAPLAILDRAVSRFHIHGLAAHRVCFIYLRRFAPYIAAEKYPHCTLLGQLMGTVLLAWEALLQLLPDVWVDTMGLPASYAPVAWLVKIPICAYVHYPIIQDEMFAKLGFRGWRSSPVAVSAKHCYWRALAWAYRYLGSCVDVSLANGSWTLAHMRQAWPYNAALSRPVELCYPPCGLTPTVPAPAPPNGARENTILYIAQFRPEKRHCNVLHQYKLFVDGMAGKPRAAVPLLVFLGSCRTRDDTATLHRVRDLVAALGLAHRVRFVVDCEFAEVQRWLAAATFGLNAMWNEHFGIGVVEYIAHGVVPIVHALGGPLLDIVRSHHEDSPRRQAWHNECGFFFKDKHDPDYRDRPRPEPGMLSFGDTAYPELGSLLTRLFDEPALLVSDGALRQMRVAGQHAAARFSDAHFDATWGACVDQLTLLEREYRETRRGKVERVY